MKRLSPTCDRHTNLQMVPCWLRQGPAIVSGHECPVPGCGRYHTQVGYLNVADIELVLGPQTGALKASASEAFKRKPALEPAVPGEERPLNRHAAARAAILRAIEAKRQP